MTYEELQKALAVCESWGNPLTGEYVITVPKGTKLLVGFAASQQDPVTLEFREGGHIQYWLNEVLLEWLQ